MVGAIELKPSSHDNTTPSCIELSTYSIFHWYFTTLNVIHPAIHMFWKPRHISSHRTAWTATLILPPNSSMLYHNRWLGPLGKKRQISQQGWWGISRWLGAASCQSSSKDKLELTEAAPAAIAWQLKQGFWISFQKDTGCGDKKGFEKNMKL